MTLQIFLRRQRYGPTLSSEEQWQTKLQAKTPQAASAPSCTSARAKRSAPFVIASLPSKGSKLIPHSTTPKACPCSGHAITILFSSMSRRDRHPGCGTHVFGDQNRPARATRRLRLQLARRHHARPTISRTGKQRELGQYVPRPVR